MIQLRDYQRSAVNAIFNDLADHESTLVAAAVGAGKTLIAATLFQEVMADYPGARCLSLAHTRELIQQNYRAMMNVWPGAPAGINSAGLGRRDTRSPLIFASIQSVAKHAARMGHFDLVLVDEAHLLPTSSDSQYRSFLAGLKIINPEMKIVGLSGTPFRLTTGYLHKGPSAMFDSMCYEIGIKDLIEKGFLVPPISLGMETQFDTKGVKTNGGEFVAHDLQARVNVTETTQAAVAEMVAVGRQQERKAWIVFCAGIAHSVAVRDEIRRHGVTCEALDGTMDGQSRGALIDAYKRGDIQCLTNVNVLSIGFDYPGIDLLALMRPTKSVGLYIQQVGRGLRCLGLDYEQSVRNGKANCIVLDYCSLVQNLGPVDRPNVPDEKVKAGGGPAPFKICPECRSYNAASAQECTTCGDIFPMALPEHKVEAKASLLPILSAEPAPPKPVGNGIEWRPVVSVVIQQYSKFGVPDAVPTLKVTYSPRGMGKVSEYICMFHPVGSYPKQKADAWWFARRFDFESPQLGDFNYGKDVSAYFEAIKIEEDKNGYDRVFAHKMRKPDDRKALEFAEANKAQEPHPFDELGDDDIPF